MPIDYNALKTEINTDPLTLGYSGKTDQAVADLLNLAPGSPGAGRQIVRTAVPIAEIYKQIDDGAWPSTAILQHKLQCLLMQPTVDASNTQTRSIIGAIFPASGGTQATRDRLLALENRPASRAEFLFGTTVFAWDVARARVA